MRFYNIYIGQTSGEKDYRIALPEEELKLLVQAFLNGEATHRVKGALIKIKEPKVFIIYSITDESLGSTKEDIESNINKWKRFTRTGKISISLYRRFGGNVSFDFLKGMEWGAMKEIVTTNSPKLKKQNGKIFISHSVKDKDVVREFTERILQIGLEVNPKTEVFNISIEDAGIKTGEDFKKRIQDELTNSIAVIQIITKNYKESEACLNEMGAAWILEIPIIPFILEPITYSSVGFIHNPNQLLKLNSKSDIKSFVAEYKGKLFSQNYDDSKLDRMIDMFLKHIDIPKKNIQTEDSTLKFTGNFLSQEEMTIKNMLSLKDNATPFFAINNHANLYYCVENKLREVPDELTKLFLGFKRWKTSSGARIDTQKYKKYFEKPLESICSMPIWTIQESPNKWIIYNGFRHLILNKETLEVMSKHKRSPFVVKRTTKIALENYPQGDVFDLSVKKNWG